MSNSKKFLPLVLLWLVGDAIAILAALNAAFLWQFKFSGLAVVERSEPLASNYQPLIAFAIPVWLLLFALHRLYDQRFLLVGLEEYCRVLRACSMGILVFIVMGWLEPAVSLSSAWVALAWVLTCVFVGVSRFALRRIIAHWRTRGHYLSHAIIVGANEGGKTIALELLPAHESGIHLVGFVDDFLPRGTRVLGDLCVLDRPAALARVAAETGATEVIVVQGAIAWESFNEIISQHATTLCHLDIKLAPGSFEIIGTDLRVSHDGFVPLVTLEKCRVTDLDARMKNILDYSFGLMGMLVLGLALVITGLVAILSGRRLAFERHENLGVGQRSFTTRKIRAERYRAHDPAFGRWMHRIGLDHLPQCWNILRGEMSFIGPRLIPLTQAESYQEWLPTLLTVKPGLIGPWAVASAEPSSFEEEIRFDMEYIRKWTIWRDARIIALAVRRMFQRRPVTTQRKPVPDYAFSPESN